MTTNAAGDETGFWMYDAFGNLSNGSPTTNFGFAGQYTDPTTGLSNMRNRWYDAQIGSFAERDPAYAITDAAYAYVDGDPVNLTDLDGLGLGLNPISDFEQLSTVAWRDVVDVPQDVSYLTYWGSYEAIKGIDSIGANFGIGGCIVAYVVSAPLVPFEAGGLGGQALGSILKGQSIWLQGIPGQPLLGNEVVPGTDFGGKTVSRWLGLPLMDFPGFDYKTHHIQFLW
jgi:RHS repeat-associated protein